MYRYDVPFRVGSVPSFEELLRWLIIMIIINIIMFIIYY